MRYFLYISKNTRNPSDQVKIIVMASDVDDAVFRTNDFITQQDFGFDVTTDDMIELIPTREGAIYYEENGFLKLIEMGAK